MPVPEYLTKYYERSPIDLVIRDVVKNTEGKLIPSELNRVKTVASVQVGIDKYRQEAKTMTQKQLQNEKHNSCRLGDFLDALVMRRPPRCHAHAIISGDHADAATLRLIMAVCGMRIDDVFNGCWLPENTAATPHPLFPRAVPHSRIHRANYYLWLQERLAALSVNNYAALARALKLITRQLHERTFPSYVMLKKGQKVIG